MSTLEQPRQGLRERNKTKRRNAVLDAALLLLDDPDPAPVTTERIAAMAEVSVATVYNLVGTREQLLLALIDRVIAELMDGVRAATPGGDPVAGLRHVIELSVDVLTTRPVGYRRVVLQLAAAANEAMHTKLSPATLAAAAFADAQQRGMVRPDLQVEALAAQLYLSYNGALLRWAAGALSEAGFKAAALHGLATILAASATPTARANAISELRRLGDELIS